MQVIKERGSYEIEDNHGGKWSFDPETSRPINPRGRTGVTNRGLLGKWGPNFAADPIVTRRNHKKESKPLEMVAIKRKDTGDWAIPGGMVDPGETVSVTIRREFTEEAGNVQESKRARLEELVGQLFTEANAHVVYRGYVDDPRNTDNAWMETTAVHYHCSPELGQLLDLHAGDDAAAVKWLEIGGEAPDYHNLYASHKAMVDTILSPDWIQME